MAASPIKRRRSRRLHRWLGLLLLVPLLTAALTGVALNHSAELGLANRHLTNSLVRNQYGMILRGYPLAFGLAGKASAARWDSHLFFRDQILDSTENLVGAVPLRDGVSVVTEKAVHYFGLDGTLIETLDSASLPDIPIIRAGRTPALTLALETSQGVFTADSELIGFTPAGPETSVEWSEKVEPAKADRELWEKTYLGDGVPLDRVILDIHSGRFFGTWGKWVWDLLVFGILILSGTGLVLFLKSVKRAR